LQLRKNGKTKNFWYEKRFTQVVSAETELWEMKELQSQFFFFFFSYFCQKIKKFAPQMKFIQWAKI
jgi:hypothetical protein